ncbi:MAG: hypothetical protein JST40_03830 [Armatimonadetes bacterium]|nr:hypothetical protein [Armatimonadota bacterium]
MQYYDKGWFGVLATVLVVGFILVMIQRAKRHEGNLFIRRIAGLNAIDEAIGRATEMGRPVVMVPGIGGLDAIAVQAINIFAKVCQTAARFATPIKLCCADPAVYAVAQETIRDVYQREGVIERFETDSVQFVSDRQFAFAAGVAGIIQREKVAAAFFLGAFFAESLIFAESANAMGAIQIAGSTQTTQTPFFVAACDYVLIGDEYYAASAYLTREPILIGSLLGQDYSKIFFAALITLGFITVSCERSFTKATGEFKEGKWVALEKERTKGPGDTFMSMWFNPQSIPEAESKVERPQREKNWWEEGGGDAAPAAGGGE